MYYCRFIFFKLCFAFIGFMCFPDEVFILILSFFPVEHCGFVSKHWELVFRKAVHLGFSRHACINDPDPPMTVEERCRQSVNGLYVRVHRIPMLLTPLKPFTNLLFVRLGVRTHCEFDALKLLHDYQNSNPGHVFSEISVHFLFTHPFPRNSYRTRVKNVHLDISCVYDVFRSMIRKLAGSFYASRSMYLRLQNLDRRPYISLVISAFKQLQHLHIQCAPYTPNKGHMVLALGTDMQIPLLKSFTCYIQSPTERSPLDMFDWCFGVRDEVRIELRWISFTPFVFQGNASDCILSWVYKSKNHPGYYFGHALLINTQSDTSLAPITPGTYARGSADGYFCESCTYVSANGYWLRWR
jgi:hypothetical protein